MGFTVRPDSTMAEFIGEVCHPLPTVLHSRLGINFLESGVGLDPTGNIAQENDAPIDVKLRC